MTRTICVSNARCEAATPATLDNLAIAQPGSRGRERIYNVGGTGQRIREVQALHGVPSRDPLRTYGADLAVFLIHASVSDLAKAAAISPCRSYSFSTLVWAVLSTAASASSAVGMTGAVADLEIATRMAKALIGFTFEYGRSPDIFPNRYV